MSLEIFSRFVNFGYKYKVSPFRLILKKSTSSWELEEKKQDAKAYKLLNSVGCFLLFVICINMLVQIIRDFQRPFHLAIDLGLCVIYIFCAYSQFLSLSNSGLANFLNNFIQCIPRTSKILILLNPHRCLY